MGDRDSASEPLGVIAQALGPRDELGGVGMPCNVDGDCRTGAACFGDERGPRLCQCRPGLQACGRRCLDLSGDPQHCGGCASRCQAGSLCEQGRCVSPVAALGAPPWPHSVVDGPVNVSPLSDSYCTHYEAYPERSLNRGNLFVAYYRDHAHFNWAPSYDGWKTAVQAPPAVIPYCLAGDPWATTSGYSGLEYFSAIGHTLSNGSCGAPTGVGIAATHSTKFGDPTTAWDYPFLLATNEPDTIYGDGPMMYFDPGGTALWVAAKGADDFWLWLYPNCQGGWPGKQGCPRADLDPVHANYERLNVTGSAERVLGHTSLIVNPCTHHAVAAYMTKTNRQRLAFIPPRGSGFKWTLDAEVSAAPNDICKDGSTCATGGICRCNAAQGKQECGSASGNCGRHFPRTQLAVKYDQASGRCYLYAGYDVVNLSLSPHRYQAKLRVVDITDEKHPVVVRTIIRPRQSWYGTPTASLFADAVGFSYYFDYEGYSTHCQTYYAGIVSTSPTFSSYNTVYLGGPFPNVWTGDYTGIIKLGLPGGYLFPTWMQPFEVASDCTACQGKHYAHRIMGARVTP